MRAERLREPANRREMIEALLWFRGLTGQQLADAAGVSPSSISRLAEGGYAHKLSLITRIAIVLRVSVPVIVYGPEYLGDSALARPSVYSVGQFDRTEAAIRLGRFVRLERQARNLEAARFARPIGMHKNQLSGIERGAWSDLTLRTVSRLGVAIDGSSPVAAAARLMRAYAGEPDPRIAMPPRALVRPQLVVLQGGSGS